MDGKAPLNLLSQAVAQLSRVVQFDPFDNISGKRSNVNKRKENMPDDLTKRGEPDQDRINVHEDWEHKRWADNPGVSEDR
jgi:hypothetical protein